MITEEQVLRRIKHIEKELASLRRAIYEAEIFVTDTENKAIKAFHRREKRHLKK